MVGGIFFLIKYKLVGYSQRRNDFNLYVVLGRKKIKDF